MRIATWTSTSVPIGGSRRARRFATVLGGLALVATPAACGADEDTGPTAASGGADGAESAGSSRSPDESAEDDDPTQAGRPILLQDWGVSFSLPADIDVTEIRIAEDPEVDAEALIIGSSLVAGEYDRSRCSGIRFELGEIISVFRFEEATDGAKQVGDAWYKVVEPLANEVCYPAPIWTKYFDPAVRETAQETLSEA